MLSADFRSSCVEWPGKCQCHLASFSLSLEVPQSISGLFLWIWVTCSEGSIWLKSLRYPPCWTLMNRNGCYHHLLLLTAGERVFPLIMPEQTVQLILLVPDMLSIYVLHCAPLKMAACKAKSVLFCWNLLKYHRISALPFACCLKPQILGKVRGRLLFLCDSRGCCVSLWVHWAGNALLHKIEKLRKLHWKRYGNVGLFVPGLQLAESWQRFTVLSLATVGPAAGSSGSLASLGLLHPAQCRFPIHNLF